MPKPKMPSNMMLSYDANLTLSFLTYPKHVQLIDYLKIKKMAKKQLRVSAKDSLDARTIKTLISHHF